ncbi:cupin domain-containing protein [Candidatus Poriferisodalis sp.]|uniref:cupin domain-containing protein n=1 Tax=Candidatus Poriferisodalis sp. TaxID=3101277 RepID=UPI003B52E0C2
MEPDQDATVHKYDDMEVLAFGEGIGLRRAAVGGLVQTWIEMTEGNASPLHRHEPEQTIVLVSGKLRARSGNNGQETYTEMGPGDMFMVPSNVMHQVEALEDSVFVEAFGPGYDADKASKSPEKRRQERAAARAAAADGEPAA